MEKEKKDGMTSSVIIDIPDVNNPAVEEEEQMVEEGGCIAAPLDNRDTNTAIPEVAVHDSSSAPIVSSHIDSDPPAVICDITNDNSPLGEEGEGGCCRIFCVLRLWCGDTCIGEACKAVKDWCVEKYEKVLEWYAGTCLSKACKAAKGSCGAVCNIVKGWCEANCLKYKAELNILASFIPLVSYVTDVSTDIITSRDYLTEGHVVWGWLVVTFTLWPIAFKAAVGITAAIKKEASVAGKCCLSLVVLVCSPFEALGLLVRDVVNRIRHYPDNDRADKEAKELGASKFNEVLNESLPQSVLQSYVVSQFLRVGKTVRPLQWVSLTASLTAAVYGLATSNYLLPKANTSSKAVFGIFGLLALCARLVVCGIYGSMNHSFFWFIPVAHMNYVPLWFISAVAYVNQFYLWFTPAAGMVIISFVAWAILRCCPCAGCPTLRDNPHRITGFVDFLWVSFYWSITTYLNSFTLSGLAVSTVALIYALCTLSLSVPQPALITGISLASLSWGCNLIIALTDGCKTIRDDWRGVTEDDDTYKFY